MRWRLTRPAQRRVPDPATTLNLPNPFHIEPIIQGAQALNGATIQQAIATYQNMLSNTTTLRQYLGSQIYWNALRERIEANAVRGVSFFGT